MILEVYSLALPTSSGSMKGAVGRLNYLYEQFKETLSTKLLNAITNYVTNPYKVRLILFNEK